MSAVATHYVGSATRSIRTVFYFGQTWTFPLIDLSGGNLRGTRMESGRAEYGTSRDYLQEVT